MHLLRILKRRLLQKQCGKEWSKECAKECRSISPYKLKQAKSFVSYKDIAAY
jgi:hypothetical protein